MPRFRNGRKLTHVQIDLPEKSTRRLKWLRDKTEAGSYSEVFADALRLYEAMILDLEEGNKIVVEQKDGTMVPYRIIY